MHYFHNLWSASGGPRLPARGSIHGPRWRDFRPQTPNLPPAAPMRSVKGVSNPLYFSIIVPESIKLMTGYRPQEQTHNWEPAGKYLSLTGNTRPDETKTNK